MSRTVPALGELINDDSVQKNETGRDFEDVLWTCFAGSETARAETNSRPHQADVLSSARSDDTSSRTASTERLKTTEAQEATTGKLQRPPGADWAAWLPGICRVGRLIRRPGGPPRQMCKQVIASDNVTKRRRGKEGLEQGKGPRDLICRGRALFGYLCRGPWVPSNATADRAGLPT